MGGPHSGLTRAFLALLRKVPTAMPFGFATCHEEERSRSVMTIDLRFLVSSAETVYCTCSAHAVRVSISRRFSRTSIWSSRSASRRRRSCLRWSSDAALRWYCWTMCRRCSFSSSAACFSSWISSPVAPMMDAAMFFALLLIACRMRETLSICSRAIASASRRACSSSICSWRSSSRLSSSTRLTSFTNCSNEVTRSSLSLLSMLFAYASSSGVGKSTGPVLKSRVTRMSGLADLSSRSGGSSRSTSLRRHMHSAKMRCFGAFSGWSAMYSRSFLNFLNAFCADRYAMRSSYGRSGASGSVCKRVQKRWKPHTARFVSGLPSSFFSSNTTSPTPRISPA
mmetsp:Transcript_16075/g.52601  ORF Transcript_16075/g.52601 Transcript_16075/m.52601 type:complete len:339 (-) Transcript_16075:746-1762(-)